MRAIGWLVLAAALDLANGTNIVLCSWTILAMLLKFAGINLADDVVFVIVSQRNIFHAERASEKRDLWFNKIKTLTGVCIDPNNTRPDCFHISISLILILTLFFRPSCLLGHREFC